MSISQHSERVGSLKARIQYAKDGLIKIKDAEKSLKETRVEKSYAEELSFAYSKNGIPLYLLNMYLPVLQEKVNYRLEQAADFQIEFITEKEKTTGGMSDTLEIVIHDDQSKIDGYVEEFEGMSGGQSTLIQFAMILSLSELQREKSGIVHEFLALDEAVTGFDPETEQQSVRMLENEVKNARQMLVISHLPTVQDLFDNIIEMEKKDGKAFIS